MAYNKEHYAKLGAVEALAQKTKEELDALEGGLGDKNIIEEIDVNGVKVEPEGKKVNITVPKNVGDLNNDSDFQSGTQVSEAIAAAIAKTGHASFKKVEKLPDYAEAEDNILYLLKNEKTNHYDIYAKVEGSEQLELLDDTTTDMTGYSTTEQMNAELAKKADKEHEHDYAGASAPGGSATSAEKLSTETAGDTNTPTYFEDGVPKPCGHTEKSDVPEGAKFTDTTYEDATAGEHGLMSTTDKSKLDGIEAASEEEVTEMITSVFSA